MNEQTLIYIIIGAIIIGIIIGGKVVLSITQATRPPMPPYTSPYHHQQHLLQEEYHGYPRHRETGIWSSILILALIILVVVIAVNNFSVNDILSDGEATSTSTVVNGDKNKKPLKTDNISPKPTPSPMPNAPEQFDPSWYTLQAGVFTDEGNAFRKLESLRAMGFSPYYHVSEIDGEKRFHVCAGVYPSFESANSAKNSLKHPSAQIYSAVGLEFYK